MKRNKEDNTVSVLQKAVKYLHIPVTNGTIKESLKSHSQYPTFKSICDVLNDWKVENFPLKYQPEKLKDVVPPYIVHFKTGSGQVAFVTEIRDDKVEYFNSLKNKKQVVLKEFYDKCSGAIIILNPDERSGQKDYREKWQAEVISNSVLPVTTIILLLFVVLSMFKAFMDGGMVVDSTQVFLILTKTAGIVLSAILVLHEYEIRLPLTDKLCHLNRATNCNTVLNDKASRIFGWISWADAGFIYFTGGLLVLLQNLKVTDYSFLAIMSALSLPYPLFSVYYQGFVLKKWCPLCLGVQLVLIIEFILLLPQFSNLHFSFTGLSGFILTFLITGIIYILSIMYFREKTDNESNYFKYIGLKKNPDVLRTLLLNQKHYNIPDTDAGLVFGEKDAFFKVTVFLSLHCSYCARAFEKIKRILKSEDKIAIIIVLITSDIKIFNTLYHLNRINKYDEALDILDQWYNADPYSRNKISENLCIPDVNDISKEVSNENLNLYKACNVLGTPTFFINGYKLPGQYNIDDIKYFLELFASKEELVVKTN